MVTDNKQHKFTITEGLVYHSDLAEILEDAGLDAENVLYDTQSIISNIREIRAALEGDDTIYDLTDEEMIAEIDEIRELAEKEREEEEANTTLYQRVTAKCLGCKPTDLEERSYDHWGLVVYTNGTNEVAVGDDSEADDAVYDCIKEELWAFKPEFVARHSKNGYSSDLAKALQLVQEEMSESSQDLVEAVIDDVDTFIDDVVREDGRGTFLNRNDSTEEEIVYDGETYYCYRIE